MNVPTMTMPEEEARRKLKAYRAAKHKDAEQLYLEAAGAYEELAKGAILLQLSRAIQHGGFFESGCPKLAIARADRREVEFRWWKYSTTSVFDSSNEFKLSRRNFRSSLVRNVDLGRETEKHITAYALVPMVPADVRPATGQLKDWHILWEVDHWHSRPQSMRASRDPMLLRHISGDLYAVIAHWDLTPIEQAILEGAMR